VAKPEVESSGKSVLPLVDEDIEFGEDVTEISKGWRMEPNSNGYYRWRWQLKDDTGQPITYVNKSGKTGYKRGSKYVGKKQD
jgi:hypothetical protein